MNRDSRRMHLMLPVIVLFCFSHARASMVEAGGPVLEGGPIAPMSLQLPTLNPAQLSGVPLSAPGLATLALPDTTLPLYSAAFARIPAGAATLQAAQQAILKRDARAAVSSALKLDASSFGSNGERASASDIQAASGEVFDGGAKTASGFGGSFDGGEGGGGSNNDGGGNDGANNGTPIEKAYPKVVVILDTFNGPASAETVQYIEKLADLGVHVVFVTPRA